jgi:predicted flap endonuclease-1-like 5' DNA nuclease
VVAAAVAAAAAMAPAPEAKPGIPRVSVSSGSGAPVKAEEGGARPSDDLTRIRGIDAVVQSKLKELGIRRFEELASLTANDVKGLSDTLGVKDRIQEENWVGQAQILGRGGETYFSRRMDQGTPIPPSAEPSAAAPKPAAAPPPEPEAKTVFPRVSVGTGSGAPVKKEDGGAGPSDDLTRIRGIDPVLQGRLKELGIRRFEELASLSANDVRGLDDALGFKDRVGPENWVGQAQTLAQGGETYYSRRLDRGIPVPESAEPTAVAPATAAATPPPQTASRAAPVPQAASAGASDVGYLRSVRSEALVGEDGGHAAIGQGDADDLKRIRGIGVLIEKKLNSLGILSYEQVANWTGADIERISNILDFKGRIERENWIEQARILATGGQTEFSRRGER